jgi:phosphoribosylformylglycinamidine cyclo-ligase
MLPAGLVAELDATTWNVPPIFRFLTEQGRVSASERFQVYNMGLGFVCAVAPHDADAALATIPESRIVGRVVAGGGEARVRGLV